VRPQDKKAARAGWVNREVQSTPEAEIYGSEILGVKPTFVDCAQAGRCMIQSAPTRVFSVTKSRGPASFEI